MRATFVLLLTTLAFVASLFVVPPPEASAARGKGIDAAIGAAHLPDRSLLMVFLN